MTKPASSSPLPDAQTMVRIYRSMTLLRRFELTAQDLNKKGAWPGFVHLYIGQEAVAVGVCDHLRRDDWITSTHRGHGHALAKGVPPNEVMAELYGKATGSSGGRGGSMHIYAADWGLLGTNGLVGGGIPMAVGSGLSARTKGTDGLGVAFFGDGGSNHGAFLESLNLAAALKAPAIFVCENNLYATATPLSLATANPEIAARAAGFGLPGISVDGNDAVAMWQAGRTAVARARAGQGPTLIEAKTYRWCGHHEGDSVCGTYRTEAELQEWKKRCPIARHRQLILDTGVATAADLDAIDREVAEIVAAAQRFGDSSPYPDPATLHHHVLAPAVPAVPAPANVATVQQGWLEAVRDGIAEEFRRQPASIYLGEGIGERGGSFGQSKGLWKEFGGQRIIDTAISELAFTGAAAGAAATGCRAVADLMFADFLFEAGSQIIHQAAKLRYLTNGRIGASAVIRAFNGMIKSAGAHHSGSYYTCFGHCPGLIVAVPSNPADAKGMMKSALRSGDPVVFLEHKALISTKGLVPVGDYTVPLGVAAVVRSGTQLTIATLGQLVGKCLEAAAKLEQLGVSVEVIDLRTIAPLDVETVAASVRRTSRLLVVDEAWSLYGVGAEVAQAVQERAFDFLDAPIGRLHTPAVPFPFSPTLDAVVGITVDQITAAARTVVAGESLVVAAPVSTLSIPVTPVAVAAPVAAPAQAPAPAHAASSPAPAGGVAIRIPNMDLTITEAKVVAWLKKPGESVSLGEPVAEIETDKSAVQVESPAAGRLAQITAQAGAVLPLGATIGYVAA